MSHPNIATLFGFFINETKSAFLYEYCSRGTLKKLLNNSELELDWVFRVSFAIDVAEGMSFLHSKKIVHGRLKPAACIVNEKWTVKIKGAELCR